MKLTAASLALGIGCFLAVSTVTLAVDAAGDDSPVESEGRKALEDGFKWLVDQQGADGGWHSETYGAMRGGAGLTSLVLYTAAQLPEDIVRPHMENLKRGWAFLVPGLRGSGKVSAPDGDSDFPTYSAGLLLAALNKLDLGQAPEELQTLILFLCRLQLDESHGFEESDVDFGGWDLMGEAERRGETMGSSISVTRFAVEGLQAHREREDVARALALVKAWTRGLQNTESDGGFYFHPDGSHLGNKAGWTDKEGKHPRSYGTCTADGVAILSILAEMGDDEEVKERLDAALGWLEKNRGIDGVPGFEFDPPESGWDKGLMYYYLMVVADVLPMLDEGRDERSAKISDWLVKDQGERGGWKSPSARMREDDPIIATSFALAALARLVEK